MTGSDAGTGASAGAAASAGAWWPPAAATSIGSLPGTSAMEAARVIVGELPDLIHVPELPARGPGADMIGRTAGLVSAVASDLGLETTPTGWRFAGGSGRPMRRAQSFLGEDLDALEEAAEGYAGTVKCQVAGPWTLAAAIELRSGERSLRDPGAVWELAEALADAIALHVADLRRRLPGAPEILVQVDEPALPAALAGRIGTASGLSSYRAVAPPDAERVLSRVLASAAAAGAIPGVHCCGDEPPLGLLRASGARFVSLDMTRLEFDTRLDQSLGELWESGVGILAGSVPAIGQADRLSDERASAPLRSVLSRLGLTDPRLLPRVAVTPSCGLAGATPVWTRIALSACRAVGSVVRDDHPEDDSGTMAP